MKCLLILILVFYSIPSAPIRTNKYYIGRLSPLSRATNIENLKSVDLIFYGMTGENDGVEKDSLVVVMLSDKIVRFSDSDNKIIREYKIQSVDTSHTRPAYALLDKEGSVAYFVHYLAEGGRWNQFFLRTDSAIEIFSHGKGVLYQRKPGNPFKRK